MAILSKIRDRSWLLILIVGLALFAFVLDPSTLADFFNSSKVNQVGEVNGETISRQEFAEALDSYKAQVGSRVTEMQAAKTVWNNLVSQKIYKNQLAEAGITVGEADILNALYDTEFIKNDARFQTTDVFDKDKFKEFLATIKAENGEEWKGWRQYMASIKSNLQKTTYDNLIGAGLGASLEEGKVEYLNENTKINADLVYLAYTSVLDSTITVTKGEVANYIKAHANEFEVEASRDISYVKIDIKPTAADDLDAKNFAGALIKDGANGELGLANATDYITFLDETKSDTPLNENIQFKNQVAQVIADTLFTGSKGDVFGPYKDKGFYKISKITEVIQMPDSVQARHILIPFLGSNSATADTKETEDQAKVIADSLATVVKGNKSKFADLAKEFSQDKSNSEKGGELDWFAYNRMVPEFRDYAFNNKRGDVGVVKTAFGFHVIDIQDQKNFQKALKLATFSRLIEASQATENIVFQKAETFALDMSKGGKIEDLAKKEQLIVSPAVGMKALDETVPGLVKERNIISWAFGKDLKIGDFKRFDIEGGYVIATLTGKTEKGLMPVDKAISKVRPILLNEKKAEILKGKLTGATLEEIATNSKQTKRTVSDINLKSPTITGVGFEPKVVGAMLNAKENQVSEKIVGDRGVYVFNVTKKTKPVDLPNYDTYRKRIANQRKNQTFAMFEAVKKSSNIEDGLSSSYYGIGQ